MSSMNQVLKAKIESRMSAVKNLDLILVNEQASLRVLRDQITDLEVQMADRVNEGRDHLRWTNWATPRLAKMKRQERDADKKIEKILETIVGHEAAIRDFKDELKSSDDRPAFIAVSSRPAPQGPRGFEGKILADLDRKGPGKNPHRKYIAKGERKKSANAQPAKKEKAAKAKNEKRGRKAA